jgi:hypothetical protein
VSGARAKEAKSKSQFVCKKLTNLPLYPITYSSLRSFYESWHDWGMAEALQRSTSMLRARIEKIDGLDLRDLPRWLSIVDFPSALHHMTIPSAKQAVPVLRTMEACVRATIANLVPQHYAWGRAKQRLKQHKVPGLSELCAANLESQRRMVCAVTRMQFGAVLEAILALESLLQFGLEEEARGAKFGRLCADACKVATFTSAHAEYVNDIQNGIEEPSAPSLWTVASSGSELDLSNLLQRQQCVKGLNCVPACIVTLLHKLQTVKFKHFESILARSIKDCPCLKTLLSNSFVVSASGLHEHLHPAARPPWCERFAYARIMKHVVAVCPAFFTRACVMTREVLRRNVIDSHASSLAHKHAMGLMKRAFGMVSTPPLGAPEAGLERSQRILLNALSFVVNDETGKAFFLPVAPTSSSTKSCVFSEETFIHRLNYLLNRERAVSEWISTLPLRRKAKTPFINTAGEMWLAAHKSVTVPLYVHAYAHSHRLTRLGTSLHQAAMEMNPLSKLVNTLTKDQQLWAQRLALRDVKSGVLPIEHVAAKMGLRLRHSPITTNRTNRTDRTGRRRQASQYVRNTQDVLECMPSGEAAAMLFAYARVAWLKEELLTIHLGNKSARLQTIGILRRLSHPKLQEALDTPAERFDVSNFTATIPPHATTLFICGECRRICNAIRAEALKSGYSFNEMGLSSCMVCRDSATDWHLRCARRPSAASAAAQSAESATINKNLASLEPNEHFWSLLQLDATRETMESEDHDSSTMQNANALRNKVRRDVKLLLEQRASVAACGEERLIDVFLVGRLVRVYGDWIGVCSVCGAFHRVLSENRIGGELCCGRCDPTLLGLARPAAKQTAALPCRFCGRYQRVGALPRWRLLRAPHDLSGYNASKPPPLRVVSYCQAHMRIWMAAAHRTLSTPVILSHLAHNARPVMIDALAARKSTREASGLLDPKRRRRRKCEPSAAVEHERELEVEDRLNTSLW